MCAGPCAMVPMWRSKDNVCGVESILFFHRYMGIELRLPGLCGEYLYLLSHLSSLEAVYFIYSSLKIFTITLLCVDVGVHSPVLCGCGVGSLTSVWILVIELVARFACKRLYPRPPWQCVLGMAVLSRN